MKYVFNPSKDWFTHNIPKWKKYLKLLPDFSQILEIGSFEGRSACWILDNIKCNLTCIDIWEKDPVIEANFDFNTAGRVHKIKAKSSLALRSLPLNFYDFIYIDGNHTPLNVLEDAVLCHRLLKKGGLLCFDDYKWKVIDISKSIDFFLETFEYEVLEKCYQVWCRRKK